MLTSNIRCWHSHSVIPCGRSGDVKMREQPSPHLLLQWRYTLLSIKITQKKPWKSVPAPHGSTLQACSWKSLALIDSFVYLGYVEWNSKYIGILMSMCTLPVTFSGECMCLRLHTWEQQVPLWSIDRCTSHHLDWKTKGNVITYIFVPN